MRFVVITALLACFLGSGHAATSECNQDLYSTAVVENGTLIAKGETAEYNGVRIRPILVDITKFLIPPNTRFCIEMTLPLTWQPTQFLHLVPRVAGLAP